jgi:hypothetical protein
VIDVAERTNLGGAGRIVLRNTSTVGKSAGVSLIDQGPSHLTRLIGLGLVEIGEEAPSLETQYEILSTDQRVRALRSFTGHYDPIKLDTFVKCQNIVKAAK